VKILVSTAVTAAVLSTAFVSVRLQHEVMRYRYRLGELERERDRADRDLRLAVSELEAAKAPRRLFDRVAGLDSPGRTAPEPRRGANRRPIARSDDEDPR
jgi:hypothetical protein